MQVKQTPQRPVRLPALGCGLYRERESQPMTWSSHWQFRDRRAASGPAESFATGAKPCAHSRRSSDKQ